MKISKHRIKRLIIEMFEKPRSYPISEPAVYFQYGDAPYFKYLFTSKDDDEYKVEIEWSNRFDLWKIDFDIVGGDFKLTNKRDLKVISTVIEAVKKFILHDLENHDDVDDKFSSCKEFLIQPATEKAGDMQRTRLFQYILKKNGIDSQLTGNPFLGFWIIFDVYPKD